MSHRITISGKKYVPPCSWNELSRKQLLVASTGVVSLLGMVQRQVNNDYCHQQLMAAKALAVGSLLGLKKNQFLKLTPAQLVDMHPVCNFLFEEECSLTRTTIDKLRIRFKTFHGPAAMFSNLTGAEFEQTEKQYNKFWQTWDRKALEHLAAILYRLKGKGEIHNPKSEIYLGDTREPFNKFQFAQRARKYFSKLPYPTLCAIFLQYHGCRNQMKRMFPTCFTTKKSSSKAANFGFSGVLMELAGGKFGNWENTRQSNVLDIFASIEVSNQNKPKPKKQRKQWPH